MPDSPRQVLIVEDEPLIAMMVEDYLDILGHACAGTADSVESARECLARGGFDCAILDVNLRHGERSWPIADALVAAGIPFILSTGSGGDEIAPAHQGRPVLAKPFTLEGIRAALARLD